MCVDMTLQRCEHRKVTRHSRKRNPLPSPEAQSELLRGILDADAVNNTTQDTVSRISLE